jgi:hypothetical protein
MRDITLASSPPILAKTEVLTEEDTWCFQESVRTRSFNQNTIHRYITFDDSSEICNETSVGSCHILRVMWSMTEIDDRRHTRQVMFCLGYTVSVL